MYRVKVVKYNSGEKIYIPQYKRLFVWYYILSNGSLFYSRVDTYYHMDAAMSAIEKHRHKSFKVRETKYIKI